MPDHPSIEGLREAVAEFECMSPSRHDKHNDSHRCHQLAKALLMRQAAYLAEHGVGWFGERLVRAERFERERYECDPDGTAWHLVPVPQDSKETT